MNKIKDHDFWINSCFSALGAFLKTFIAALICKIIFTVITVKIAVAVAIITAIVSIIWSIAFDTPESCIMDYDAEDEDTDLADLEAD